MNDSDLSPGQFWVYFIGFVLVVLGLWWVFDEAAEEEREQERREVGSDYTGYSDVAP